MYWFAVSADGHEIGAPVIGAPHGGCLNGGARYEGSFQHVESERRNVGLHCDVVGFPGGVAKWEVNEDKAGDADGLNNVAGAPYNDGGDAVFFEMAGDQTDRLMTDRSKGDEHDDVDIVLAAPGKNPFGILERFALAIGGGEAVEAGRQRADPAFGNG